MSICACPLRTQPGAIHSPWDPHGCRFGLCSLQVMAVEVYGSPADTPCTISQAQHP